MSFSSILYTIILYPLIQIIEIAFSLFDKLFGNTGIAIIGVSFTVTLLCLPLYIVAEHWQQVQRDTENKLKPGIDRIKAVFKGDEQYMILNTFYKQNHYHPMMALRSSFGLLIQVPFFMAAYSCLSSLPALQGQSFLFIKDMAKPDALFSIGSFDVNILPIAMTLINIIAGAIYTKGFAFKDKAQIYGMALLFLVILYTSPAGLVLYWTMNNVFSLVKNIFYKLKNPIKVLYILMCIGIVAVDIYILFIYNGSLNTKKRLCLVIPLTCLIALPYFIKAINWMLQKPLNGIVQNKRQRFTLFILSACGATILTGLVLPSQLISSSVLEFSNIGNYTNPRTFLLFSFWQSFGLFIFWPICIYFLYKEKIQTIISTIFSVGLIAGIINAFVFVGKYGSLDITLKFTDGFVNQSILFTILNFVIMTVAIVVIFVLYFYNKTKIITSLISVISASFLILSFINIGKITSEYKAYAKLDSGEEFSKVQQLFNLSAENKNVVVIMLDRAKSNYFESILEDQPQLKEDFSGFTYYKNTVAYNEHTLIGSPGIYGGYEYTPSEMNKTQGVSLKEKHNQALLLMPRIFTEQANFDATVSDLSWGNYNIISDMSFTNDYEKINGLKLIGKFTSLFTKEFGGATSNDISELLQRNLFWVSVFRQAPVAIRPLIYYEGKYFNFGESLHQEDISAFVDWYSELQYLPKITNYNAEKSNFICITNEVTHANLNINHFNLISEDELSHPKSPSYDINTVSYLRLADWFKELKKNNVYDNTKIIIVSDHAMGYGDNTDKFYDNPKVGNKKKDTFHPILLVKEFNAKGTIKTDMTFMTNADVPTIAFNNVIENPVNPFTGNLINSSLKKDGVYITLSDIFMPHHQKSKNVFDIKDHEWYKVKDNIFIDSNWTQEVPQ